MNIMFVNDPHVDVAPPSDALVPSIYVPGKRFVSEGGHRFYHKDAVHRGGGKLIPEAAIRWDELEKFCDTDDGYLTTNPRPTCLDHPKWGMDPARDIAWRRTPEAYEIFRIVAKHLRSASGEDVWQYGTWDEVGGAMSYSANIDSPLRGMVMTREQRRADYVYVRAAGQKGGWTADDVAEALHQCRVFGVPNVVVWHDPTVWNLDLYTQTMGALAAYAGQPCMPWVEGGGT